MTDDVRRLERERVFEHALRWHRAALTTGSSKAMSYQLTQAIIDHYEAVLRDVAAALSRDEARLGAACELTRHVLTSQPKVPG
jgi:hypothetical protein